MSAISSFPGPAAARIDLRSARLRANPSYELVLFDRLTPAEQQMLHSVESDPEYYGVLRPRKDSGSSMKLISRDTALLLFSLQQTGPLPRFAVRMLGDECSATIARMVLDGILEIEADGAMISGAAAFASVIGEAKVPVTESRLAALSRRAIEYAASLAVAHWSELSARLYSYNTIPASARWRASLPGVAATAQYLGLHDGPAACALAAHWHALPETPSWISYRAHIDSGAKSQRPAPLPAYKLYVSPACDRVRDAMEAVAHAVEHSHALQWKVGRGVHGLLRPDKMVIYFREFADLQEVALKITHQLQGCPAHGVPFTAELADGGLLSWGIDPPRDTTGLSRLGGESWRGKLCNHLAIAMMQAKDSAEEATGDIRTYGARAGEFALQRLRLEGIDTVTWAPAHGFVWNT